MAATNPPIGRLLALISSKDVSVRSGLGVGNTVSLRGLLFKTSTVPELVARKVRKR